MLVGQSLRLKGPTKLLSRASNGVNKNVPYSFVLEPDRLALYYKSQNSPKPYLYYAWRDVYGPLEVKFYSEPETSEGYAYDINLEYQGTGSTGAVFLLNRPKYNATLSFLRLWPDGNLRIHTFYQHVMWGAWEETFTLLSRDSTWGNECQLPERCGKFGLCEDNQCVACPSLKGLMGWSKDREPKKVTKCGVDDFYYYKIKGVDHFVSKYTSGDGPMKKGECEKKCTRDCKCLGYFYHQQTSSC